MRLDWGLLWVALVLKQGAPRTTGCKDVLVMRFDSKQRINHMEPFIHFNKRVKITLVFHFSKSIKESGKLSILFFG
jgi:hypothetical protein